MRKLIDFRQYVSFDGGETFEDTSMWCNLHYRESTEEEVEVLETFEQAYNYIKENNLMNAEIDTTCLSDHKQIHISTEDLDCIRTFTEKNFKPIIVKSVFQEKGSNLSMKILASMLPAGEFCEWLKDRNIAQASEV